MLSLTSLRTAKWPWLLVETIQRYIAWLMQGIWDAVQSICAAQKAECAVQDTEMCSANISNICLWTFTQIPDIKVTILSLINSPHLWLSSYSHSSCLTLPHYIPVTCPTRDNYFRSINVNQFSILGLLLLIIIIYVLRQSSKTSPEQKKHTYNTLKRKQYTE